MKLLSLTVVLAVLASAQAETTEGTPDSGGPHALWPKCYERLYTAPT